MFNTSLRHFSVPLFKRNLLGVDIGSSSIKIVRLKKTRGECRLKDVGYIKLPVRGDRNSIAEALKAMMNIQRIGGSHRVASAIAGRSLAFSYIKLPKMPIPDLREAVKWEVKKGIDFPDEAVTDFVVNDEVVEEGKTILSILAFAVRKEEISEHVGILKEASLIPDAIDVGPMALLSAFDYNYRREKDKRYAILDIGASRATLIIISNGSIRFTRYIPFGGNDITKSIQNMEGIEFQAAEEKKVHFGPILDNSPEIIQTAVRSFLEGVSTELRLSFRYYQAQLREGAVDKILICGGCSLIKGIAKYMEDAVGVPAAIYDTLKGVKAEASQDVDLSLLSPLITAAFGLALRREGE